MQADFFSFGLSLSSLQANFLSFFYLHIQALTVTSWSIKVLSKSSWVIRLKINLHHGPLPGIGGFFLKKEGGRGSLSPATNAQGGQGGRSSTVQITKSSNGSRLVCTGSYEIKWQNTTIRFFCSLEIDKKNDCVGNHSRSFLWCSMGGSRQCTFGRLSSRTTHTTKSRMRREQHKSTKQIQKRKHSQGACSRWSPINTKYEPHKVQTKHVVNGQCELESEALFTH